MKATGHPPYAETTIVCACGSSVKVRSTAKNLHINSCSACHPFYTGKSALADAKGRVEQFRKRYQQAGK
jgi:large subunit ribosomal protein L31